eukprot:GILK01015044.1.p1 GENE.GILK01015044.1~~GILK01015044.1.p1  ORF type:complete len:331 (+),score=42.57 GILK01015044.1:83-1075(+)
MAAIRSGDASRGAAGAVKSDEPAQTSSFARVYLRKTESDRIKRRELIHYMARLSHEFPSLSVVDDYLTQDAVYQCPVGTRSCKGPAETKQLLQTLFVDKFASLTMYPVGRIVIDDTLMMGKRVIAGVLKNGQRTTLFGIVFVTLDVNGMVTGWWDYWSPTLLEQNMNGVPTELLLPDRFSTARGIVNNFIANGYMKDDFFNLMFVDTVKFGFPASAPISGKSSALSKMASLRDQCASILPVLEGEVYEHLNHFAFECSLVIVTKTGYKFHLRGGIIGECDEDMQGIRSWLHLFDQVFFRHQMEGGLNLSREDMQDRIEELPQKRRRTEEP